MNEIPKNSGIINKHFLYPIANLLAPIFYKFGFTPNMITTLTLILRIFIIYSLYHKRNYSIIIILFIISWITDGIDGQIARKYNMKSKFGAIYDVLVDNITILAIIIVLFLKHYVKNRKPYYIILCFIPIMLCIQIIKTRCSKKKEMKIWEKNILYNENINLDKKECKNIAVIKLYDEGINYLLITLTLIYTLYFHKDKV
jgi:phosphatidylglycerophosphate synthase